MAGSAGTGGITGASGSSGQGVAAGDEAVPLLDASGSADAATDDGMTAADDAEVDASTDDMTDGAIIEAPEPKPGEVYGQCRADGSCDASRFCSLDVTGGGGATYCSQFCSLISPMCPAGPSGMPGTCIANVCAR